MKEQDVIEQYGNLLNKIRAHRTEEYCKEYDKGTSKLYRENNRDKVLKNKNLHYKNNKDKIKEKITCECGYELNKNNMTRHRKTKKHIKLMESNTTL